MQNLESQIRKVLNNQCLEKTGLTSRHLGMVQRLHHKLEWDHASYDGVKVSIRVP